METNNKTNVYLVGYPGSGKTTIGKLLAIKLNRSFTDVDKYIENRYHRTIATLFEEKGEAGFREIERRSLQEISGFENVLVSTGGGLPCFFDNMDVMNQTGMTIYLKTNVNDLLNRLDSNIHNRPLINGKSSEELRDFVEMNLKKRESFYNQAKCIIEVPNFSSKKEMNQWVDELTICI